MLSFLPSIHRSSVAGAFHAGHPAPHVTTRRGALPCMRVADPEDLFGSLSEALADFANFNKRTAASPDSVADAAAAAAATLDDAECDVNPFLSTAAADVATPPEKVLADVAVTETETVADAAAAAAAKMDEADCHVNPFLSNTEVAPGPTKYDPAPPLEPPPSAPPPMEAALTTEQDAVVAEDHASTVAEANAVVDQRIAESSAALAALEEAEEAADIASQFAALAAELEEAAMARQKKRPNKSNKAAAKKAAEEAKAAKADAEEKEALCVKADEAAAEAGKAAEEALAAAKFAAVGAKAVAEMEAQFSAVAKRAVEERSAMFNDQAMVVIEDGRNIDVDISENLSLAEQEDEEVSGMIKDELMSLGVFIPTASEKIKKADLVASLLHARAEAYRRCNGKLEVSEMSEEEIKGELRMFNVMPPAGEKAELETALLNARADGWGRIQGRPMGTPSQWNNPNGVGNPSYDNRMYRERVDPGPPQWAGDRAPRGDERPPMDERYRQRVPEPRMPRPPPRGRPSRLDGPPRGPVPGYGPPPGWGPGFW